MASDKPGVQSEIYRAGGIMSGTKKFVFEIPLRFKDLDAMGHVNNAVYLTYYEEGRKEFFVRVLGSSSPSDFPFVLARVSCDYLRPIELEEQRVEGVVWISKMGNKSFEFSYEIRRVGEPEIVFSRGKSVQVFYDYRKNKSRNIPSQFKRLVADYLWER